jgi:hypothetical protein
MAISTFRVALMHSEDDGATYEKFLDIKSFPPLGGAPEMLETTTLSDRMQTFIAGIQSLDALDFVANYTKENYQKCMDIEGKNHKYAVWFGGAGSGDSFAPTGEHGKFTFDGELSAYPDGGGVNEVVNLNITIAASTEIVPDLS